MKLSHRFVSWCGVAGVVAVALAPTAFAREADGISIHAQELADNSGEGFVVEVVDGSAAVGQRATVKVTIKAKDGFKVNDQYPHGLKLEASDDIVYEKDALKRDDGRFDGKTAFVFEVGAKAKRAGSHAVAGKLKFSVCNDAQCLIQKIDLSAKVTAR
jgi:hypothetical protein